MAQHPVELILAKQLAGSLSTAISIVGPEGEFLFMNEAAERVMGCAFDEMGDLDVADTSRLFSVSDDEGQPIPAESMLFAIALREQRPAHRTFYIRALDGISRRVTATAFPLISHNGRQLGAVAFMWEDGPCN